MDSRRSRSAKDIKQRLLEQLENMGDKETRDLVMGNEQVSLVYLKSMCDPSLVTENLINRFYELRDVSEYETYVKSFPSSKEAKDAEETLEGILTGYTSVFIKDHVYLFDVLLVEGSIVLPAETENVIQGPTDSFTENIDTNMNLVRRRYKTADLKSESMTIGRVSKTRIAILYDITRVEKKVLDELRKRLSGIDADIIQTAADIERFTMNPKFRLFPTVMVSERPDRTVLNISQGKIAVMVDTTGYVILLPAIFNDYFTAMDDKVQLPPIGWFLKVIRYIGLFLTVLLPSLYVAFTSYNPEILKMQITLLIAGSRATVPYPSFFEVLFMLLAMEFLTEASVRLPKAIGPTATTVGGLILGTAATEAGLVSNIMIILVAAVAITNFVIPVTMMSFGIRLSKYIFILLSTFFGLVGIVLGIIAMIMYLCSLRSFGKPYLKMFAVERNGKEGQRSG
ncbi:spore germination protein [Paenibacillus sp. DMB20]|uniref:spore germination protein n=1 Tax=Paenibacillus sp. DMB20 TaxID=1642570 RepID=UPI000627C792|nr:spore germination protein [Paenibacillus sp. DMB20]KKO54695.1 spore gernimation protein GerA [Paenibacillus sp. DMB20]